MRGAIRLNSLGTRELRKAAVSLTSNASSFIKGLEFFAAEV
jgi:hypothetical protein